MHLKASLTLYLPKRFKCRIHNIVNFGRADCFSIFPLYRFPGQHSLAFHRPHVLATSSMAGRNNGANCFARVERKLVLTGARAMIHREDLRDERVRVRAG